MRYWRQWLLCHKQYTLEKNFITLNSYICIELNAHALITSLLVLRDKLSEIGSDSYLPWMFGSQPCEKAFRAARSMTPMFSTIINFSVLGLLRRLHKLQIKVELESLSNTTGIIYPHQNVHKAKEGINKTHRHSLAGITNQDIENAVKCGLDRARSVVEELKMKDLLVETNSWDRAFGDVGEVELNNGEDMVEENEDGEAKNDTLNEESTITDIISHEISELDDHECKEIIENLTNLEKEEVIDNAVKETICTYMRKTNTSNSDNRTSIPLYSQVTQREHKSGDKLIKNNNKFVEINHNERLIFVRKSTLVWLFQEGERVSADRLFRVRAKQPFSTPIQPIRPQSDFSVPEVREFIELGEFCVFQDVTTKEWSIV